MGALEIEVWVSKMKKYFLDQLEGRGHVHIDKKYISEMRNFVDGGTASESLRVFVDSNELVNFIKKLESLAKDKTK
ncbi:MAG: hypothetical protein ACRBB5_02130 [Nitrosopumilus sp.]